MRKEEALWIGRELGKISDLSPVLELGSSTREFRTVLRPHIHHLIHKPLLQRGIQVVHSDYKQDDGVDIAGDIFDPGVQAQLRAIRPKAILCCNMFEHIDARTALASVCTEVLSPGGYLVFTGPYSYPYHRDPIDTYFRPTPEEVAKMFPGFDVLRSEIVESPGWGSEIMLAPRRIPFLVVQRVYLLCKFWAGWDTYREMNHRLLWLFRPYKISCVILRKRASLPPASAL